jgi:hypothetical protein
MPRFAADLAKELGGEQKPDPEHPQTYQYIRLGTDEVRLNADNYKKRVWVSIDAPEIPHGDWSRYDSAQQIVGAGINPDGRSIAAIARDIKKRVIDLNQPALAARRAYAAKQQQNRSDIVQHLDALQAAHPALQIRMHDDKQSAGFFSRSGARHIDGQLDSSGRVRIKSIDSVSAKAFAKIMAALQDDK